MKTARTVTLSDETIDKLARALKDLPESKPEAAPSPLDVLYLSMAKAARRQGVSQDTIRRMIDRGELKAYKFGKSIRIKISDLDKASKPIKTIGDLMDGAAQ